MSGLANLNGFSVARTTAYTELQVATLNAANALVGGLVYGATTITALAATVDVTTPVTFLDTSALGGAQAITLPDGQTPGQQKQFIWVDNTQDSVITPNTAFVGGGTTITFDTATNGAPGQCVTLVWTGAAWAIVSRAATGTTVSGSVTETQVRGYPVVA